MTSREYYEEGNENRRKGNFAAAINSYIKAIELDAESPAVEATAMLADIPNFYNTAASNP